MFRCYASAVINKVTGEIVIKLINVSISPATYQIDLQGIEITKSNGTMETLSAANRYAFNSLDQQKNIYPVESVVNIKNNKVTVALQPISVNVIKVQQKM